MYLTTTTPSQTKSRRSEDGQKDGQADQHHPQRIERSRLGCGDDAAIDAAKYAEENDRERPDRPQAGDALRQGWSVVETWRKYRIAGGAHYYHRDVDSSPRR